MVQKTVYCSTAKLRVRINTPCDLLFI
jgi:hypothetical protein